MSDKKVAPVWFRLKAWELAKALESEHDLMTQPAGGADVEFDQEAMERDYPEIWDRYTDINGRIWELVMELEQIAGDGPNSQYGIPTE